MFPVQWVHAFAHPTCLIWCLYIWTQHKQQQTATSTHSPSFPPDQCTVADQVTTVVPPCLQQQQQQQDWGVQFKRDLEPSTVRSQQVELRQISCVRLIHVHLSVFGDQPRSSVRSSGSFHPLQTAQGHFRNYSPDDDTFFKNNRLQAELLIQAFLFIQRLRPQTVTRLFIGTERRGKRRDIYSLHVVKYCVCKISYYV